ncbi:hypothetical protein Dimus_013213 [Dionaea muscipula]
MKRLAKEFHRRRAPLLAEKPLAAHDEGAREEGNRCPQLDVAARQPWCSLHCSAPLVCSPSAPSAAGAHDGDDRTDATRVVVARRWSSSLPSCSARWMRRSQLHEAPLLAARSWKMKLLVAFELHAWAS